MKSPTVNWSHLPYWIEPISAHTPCSSCQVLGQPGLLSGIKEFWREDPQDKWFLQLLGPYLKIPNQGQLVTSSEAPAWMANSWFQVQAWTALRRTGGKMRDRLSRQGRATLAGKPAPHGDGGLVSWVGTRLPLTDREWNQTFLGSCQPS